MRLKLNEQGFTHPMAFMAVVMVVALIGFAGYQVSQANTARSRLASQQAALEKGALPADLSRVMTVQKINEVVAETTNATVTGIELKAQNAQLIFAIKLSDGAVYGLQAVTGQRVELSADTPDEDVATALPSDFSVDTSFDRAREIAQEQFPDSTVVNIELDVVVNKIVLSVRFADKAKVDIDSAAGDVVRVRQPREDASPAAGSPAGGAPESGAVSGTGPGGSATSGSSGAGAHDSSVPSGDLDNAAVGPEIDPGEAADASGNAEGNEEGTAL